MSIRSLSAILLLAACGSDPPVITSVSVNPTSVPAGGETTLTVSVEHFELRSPDVGHALTAAQAHEGESAGYPDGGHYHVYLDDVMTNPLLVDCPDYCSYAAYGTSVRLQIPGDTTPGTKTLIVRLNDDGHKTLTPHIMATTTLEVTAP